MPKVTFFLPDSNEGKVIEAKPDATVLETALAAGLPIENECGGCCSCGTCECVIEAGAGNLSPSTSDERGVLRFSKTASPKSRLGCQSQIKGDVSIRLRKA